MAPSNSAGKRVKGKQVYRPFIYGTTARPFDPDKNPKPPGTPEDHTHSWSVFVKGIDDVDITYWLKRVQFKLHESIPNHVRMIDGQKGEPFAVHETGWGEFEITIKMYYVPESSEKAQTLYHHLRLHAYGSETEKNAMIANGEVVAWVYEEQVFNEPYEAFYDTLTSGAMPPSDAAASSKNKAGGKGGKGGGGKEAGSQAPKRSEGGVLERSAMIPMTTRPGQPFSAEAEKFEVKKLSDAQGEIDKLVEQLRIEVKEKEDRLKSLKDEAK
ncbi:NuA4 histone H4 acetyltransferase complex and the SWR1 complex subunit [Diaporthe australafricana]|uniref:Protein AF-9 homolog n=1 Tax=Diaporthe australafricana TaxID=127596 RepID=A0ABR3VYJ6_9PEZI